MKLLLILLGLAVLFGGGAWALRKHDDALSKRAWSCGYAQHRYDTIHTEANLKAVQEECAKISLGEPK